jgi:predicted nucleotide-binding protein
MTKVGISKTVRELQLLTEALWESIKVDLTFFSSIQVFVKKLSETDYGSLTTESISEILFFARKIEEFFAKYRASLNSSYIYIPPTQTAKNDAIVKDILRLAIELSETPKEEVMSFEKESKLNTTQISKGTGVVFIGHGRSKLWARVQLFLKDDLNIESITFESESHTNESIVNILEDFLIKASYAVLILTAEDETSDGKTRARQNVIHEAGLFQGRLGFNKVIILKQDTIEEFSNISGLQYIPFTGDNIEQTFYELQRTLKKAGLVKS